METRVLTIMMTDIQGFTERTASTSREDLDRLLGLHEDLLLPIVKIFHGTLVKTIGDALLVTFESPTNAVLCGLMMQERLKEHNAEMSDGDQLHVRVAISTGEVQVRDSDVFGEAVNIAARIEGITEAGEIFFTEAVYLAMNKSEVPSSEVGHHRLKGIPEAIKVYKVIQDENSEQYQGLLERLRSRNFDDIAEPTDAEQNVLSSHRFRMKKPWWSVAGVIGATLVVAWILFRDPIAGEIERIDSALLSGNTEQAMAIADLLVNEKPGDERVVAALRKVVNAEIQYFLDKKSYNAATEHTNGRERKYAFLTLDDQRKRILITRAADYVSQGNIRASLDVYDILLQRHAGEDVWFEIMKQIGKGDYPQPLAIRAALNYANSTESEGTELSALPGEVLLKALRHRGSYGDGSRKIRKILYSRYPKSIEVSRQHVTDDDYEHRGNSFYLLKESGKLTDSEAMRYHFYNLMNLNTSHRTAHDEAVAHFRAAANKPEWKAVKQAAGLVVPTDPPVFRSFGFHGKDSSKVVVDLFMPEIESVLVRYLESDVSAQRVNAWYMLKAAGKTALLNPDKFHAKTLRNFDARYKPKYFVDAVEYFKKRAKRKPALAKKALLGGVVHIRGTLKEYSGFAGGWKKTIERNLKIVQRALRKIR